MLHRVSAQLSERSRRGWERVLYRGCSFSALIEAIGLALDDRSLQLSDDIVQRARDVDQERNSRRRKG